jgi:class 3 adenylate cyclase
VLKRLGDGLMALFGYPQAQENDAERAVMSRHRTAWRWRPAIAGNEIGRNQGRRQW